MQFVQSHPAFNDTIDSLKHEFREDMSNDVIICGAHDLSHTQSIDDYKRKYGKVIVFNQEPLLAKQRNFMHIGYFAWLSMADEVWDYDEENLKVLRLIRPDVKLHVLKPYKRWPTEAKKDIDILFYGSMNKHRRNILGALSKHNKVKILDNCWDSNELDQWILRSKVLLNLHFYYETALQEQARMIRWIGSQFTIVEQVPPNAIRFKLKKPPKLSLETALNTMKFDDSWITIE